MKERKKKNKKYTPKDDQTRELRKRNTNSQIGSQETSENKR